MPTKLLVLQHVPHEHPGYITDYARDKNIQLDVVELWHPYVIPVVSDYAGVIIMGGPMGVYEEFSSKKYEIALIQECVETTHSWIKAISYFFEENSSYTPMGPPIMITPA